MTRGRRQIPRRARFDSTNDTIEAASEQEAIEKAILDWKKVEPGFTFAPLFSTPVTLGQPLGQP